MSFTQYKNLSNQTYNGVRLKFNSRFSVGRFSHFLKHFSKRIWKQMIFRLKVLWTYRATGIRNKTGCCIIMGGVLEAKGRGCRFTLYHTLLKMGVSLHTMANELQHLLLTVLLHPIITITCLQVIFFLRKEHNSLPKLASKNLKFFISQTISEKWQWFWLIY